MSQFRKVALSCLKLSFTYMMLTFRASTMYSGHQFRGLWSLIILCLCSLHESKMYHSHFYEGRWWGAWTLQRGIPWRPQSRRGPGAYSCQGNAFPETRHSVCGFAACWFALLNPRRAPAVGPAPVTSGSPARSSGENTVLVSTGHCGRISVL